MKRLIGVVTFLLIGLVVAGAQPAAAAPPSDVRAQLSGSLGSAVDAQAKLEAALQQNASERDAVRQELEQTDARIGQLDSSIAARDAQIKKLTSRIDGERAQITALARAIDEEPDSILARLVSASRQGDLVSGLAELTAAGRRGNQLASALDWNRLVLQTQQNTEQAERDSQAAMRVSQQAELDRLWQLMVQESSVGTQLAASIQQTQDALNSSASTDPAIAAQLEQWLLQDQLMVVAEAQQVAWDQAAFWVDDNPQAMASLASAPVTGFSWPVQGATLTQPFGPTSLTIEPPYGGYPHFHTGLDLANSQGTPITAAADGMVAGVASGNTGYGNYVIIAHAGGMMTLYGHMLQTQVAVGQRVTQGQQIGLVGSTGNSTGPHCHFEVRQGNQPLNPLPLLGTPGS